MVKFLGSHICMFVRNFYGFFVLSTWRFGLHTNGMLVLVAGNSLVRISALGADGGVSLLP